MPSGRFGFAQASTGGCGRPCAPVFSSTSAAGPSGSIIPVTAPPTLSTVAPDARACSVPVTAGLPTALGSPASRSAPGHRSPAGWCGVTAGSQDVTAEVRVLGDPAQLLLDEGGVD